MMKKLLLTVTLLAASLGLQAAPISYAPKTTNLDIGFADFYPSAWIAIFDFDEDPACDAGQSLQDCRFGNPLIIGNTVVTETTDMVDIESSGLSDYSATNPVSNSSVPLLNSPRFILAASFDQGASWWNPLSSQLVGAATDGRDVFKVNFIGTDASNIQQTVSTILLIDPQVAVIPVPAALWLFGSGLIGLIAVARRSR